MKENSYNRVFWGSFWGISSTLLDALIKLFTVPLLIGFYGKSDFGLISLAFALNAYLRLTELGMNTGGIKYFSQWIQEKKIDKIIGLSQSSIIFYGIVGLINGAIIFIIGYFSNTIFQLNNYQYDVFRWICLILCVSSLFNWISFVFVQLLTAREDFIWLKQAEIVRNILNLCSVGIAIFFRLSLPLYFLIFTVTNLSLFPLNLIRLKKIKIPFSILIKPKWNKYIFKEVLNYSLSIFILSIFQYTANFFRPILLGIFDSKGVNSVAEFRILQSITQLIIAISSVFMGILLPISSKNFIIGDFKKKMHLYMMGLNILPFYYHIL